MNLEEILELDDVGQILSKAQSSGISGQVLTSNQKFREKLNYHISQYGFDWKIMRSLVEYAGESACVDCIDIENVSHAQKSEIFFSSIMERGNADVVIDKSLEDDAFNKVFIKNVDKFYSNLARCDSSKIMKLIDKSSQEENTKNLGELVRHGLEDEDKKKILEGQYNPSVMEAAIDTLSKDELQHYLDKDSKAVYQYRYLNVIKKARDGISFPPDIVKQKEFFEKIKSDDMEEFRANIDTIYKTSYHPVLENRIKNYEENILKDYNPEKGIFNSYDLDDVKKVEERVYSPLNYLIDKDVNPELGNYLTEVRRAEEQASICNDELRGKYNLNLSIDEILDMDISNISDDKDVQRQIDQMRQKYSQVKKQLEDKKSETLDNLRKITSSKFGEVLADFELDDTKTNVIVNTREVLRYNKKLSDNEKISKENQEIYEKFLNIDGISMEEKYELYNDLKDKNIASELSQDFRTLKRHSYRNISQCLYRSQDDPESLLDAQTVRDDTPIYKLQDKPFYMLVRQMDKSIRDTTQNEQDSYSLISNENLSYFHEYEKNEDGTKKGFLYGYSNLDPERVVNVFERDSFTMGKSDEKITDRPNRIMTKEEIVKGNGSENTYSEINIKNKKNDQKGEYEPMRPSYIVCMDNEPTQDEIEESKRLGVPVVMVDRQRYQEQNEKNKQELTQAQKDKKEEQDRSDHGDNASRNRSWDDGSKAKSSQVGYYSPSHER